MGRNIRGSLKIQFLSALAGLILSSCYKDQPCENNSFFPAFSGYDLSDMKGVKILYYDAATSSPNPFQSYSAFTTENWKQHVVLKAAPVDVFYRSKGYEMEIIVPKHDKIYRVTNIVWGKKTEKCRNLFGVQDCKGGACHNDPIQCTLDGVIYKMEDFEDNQKVVVFPR